MNPRVLLDVDGVLADFHTPCIEIINRLGGTNHKVEDFDDWDIFDALKTPKEVKRATYEEMNKPGWCTNIAVYPGAIEGVKRLQTVADVFIVTAPMRGETWTSERDRWLMRNFDITTKRIIHTSAKYVCAGDMLVDDKIDNLVKWHECHPGGVAVRWFMPHMAHHKYEHGPSTNDWNVLAQIASQIVHHGSQHRAWRRHG